MDATSTPTTNHFIFLITIPAVFCISASDKLVYHVRPDDDDSFLSNTLPDIHTLSYYLLNASKYFASNTELKFLAGIHQLDATILIKDAHHFSLSGSLGSGTINSTLECGPASGIVIINSSHVNIENVVLKNCHTDLDYAVYLKSDVASILFSASLLINNSHSLHIRHLATLQKFFLYYDIVLINVLNSTLNDVSSSSGIVIIYNMDNHSAITNNNTLLLQAYKSDPQAYKPDTVPSVSEMFEIVMNFIEYPSDVAVKISNIQFKSDKALFVYSYTTGICDGINKVIVTNCSFDNIVLEEQESLVIIIVDNYLCSGSKRQTNLISFMDCTFSNIVNMEKRLTKYIIQFYNIDSKSLLYIANSQFYNNNGTIILTVPHNFKYSIKHLRYSPGMRLFVFVKNVTFSQLWNIDFVMDLHNINIKFEGPVIFSEMEIDMAVVYGKRMQLIFSSYIEFSEIDTFFIIMSECVYLSPNTNVYLSFNIIRQSIFVNEDVNVNFIYSRLCMFQYISNDTYNFNISIIITKTRFAKLCQNKYCATHCSWVGNALLNEISPLAVNRQVIKFFDLKDTNRTISDKKDICYCTDSFSYNCHLDEINLVYPGQTVHLHIINTIADVKYLMVTVNTTKTSCRIARSSEMDQRVYNNCSLMHFTILYHKKCRELVLSYPPFGEDIFYVNFQPCPIGFSLNQLEGYCQCDPILTSTTIISITTCNINDQTISRPGNSWIHATSNQTYQVSSHCPFHYCLSNPSSLNPSNPDSQCRYNRTKLLCGKCQDGLSAVFGMPNCKKCSNAFLFTAIPIALAGIVLLLILFVLNVTVTDGTINAFILYVNIISINSSTHFTHQSTAHVFVSLANLDLGFEMCFYDGMDDYAKMWLQLAFPAYLILIATLLIMASRYSTTIQRLTACRALPVLATLFLLSYTKILRTVSNVLFFYSTITDLPSNKAITVWSVDANIPLFGIKFTILFTVCLILLIIIIPLNVVLTFTRILSRHRVINYFKPLLDAYQGPYNTQYYFWPGLQLIIRAVFFGLSALDKGINLATGLVVLAAMLGIHGYIHPFKSSFKNIQELVSSSTS